MARSRKLHPPAQGPTRLYRSEDVLYAELKARKPSATFPQCDLDDDGRPCKLLLIEGTSELVVCYDRDADGSDLPWQQRLYEVLGTVTGPEGQVLSWVDVRKRAHELRLACDGRLEKLRYLLAGGEGYVRTYPSERAFVDANPQGRCFPQMDFGFTWREGGCQYRVGLVPESGEVIAVLRGFEPYSRTEVLGQVADPEQLQELLKPLWRLASTRDSLARVRGALQTLPKRAPSRTRLSPLAA